VNKYVIIFIGPLYPNDLFLSSVIENTVALVFKFTRSVVGFLLKVYIVDMVIAM